MTSSEFLTTFQRYLIVRSPKREEVITEVHAHLAERAELGDPQQQARAFNQVYFGRYGTFEWLLLRAMIFPVVDWIVQDSLTSQIIERGRTGWVYLLLTLSFFVHLLSLVNILTSAHALAHMHRRWVKAGWWGLTVLFTSVVLVLYTQFRFSSVVTPLQDWPNFFWNIGYLVLTSIIFIPAFFISWPTRTVSFAQKLLTFVVICVVTYVLWVVVNDLFSGLFTWLYTYPWVLKSLPNGLQGWDSAIILAITGLFFLHEIRFTQRLHRLRK